MSEKREYTAKEYQALWKTVDRLSAWSGVGPGRRSITVPNGDVEMLLAALHIAAQVMRPGGIEDAVKHWLDEDDGNHDETEAAAIRKALLGEAEDAGR